MSAIEVAALLCVGSMVGGFLVYPLVMVLWELHHDPEDFDPPTEEMHVGPGMLIAPIPFEEFGPGKPVPPSAEQLNELWERS